MGRLGHQAPCSCKCLLLVMCLREKEKGMGLAEAHDADWDAERGSQVNSGLGCRVRAEPCRC